MTGLEIGLIFLCTLLALGALALHCEHLGREEDQRRRIDILEATLGMGEERARREAAAKLRSRAIHLADSVCGSDRSQVEALLTHANQVEKGGPA